MATGNRMGLCYLWMNLKGQRHTEEMHSVHAPSSSSSSSTKPRPGGIKIYIVVHINVEVCAGMRCVKYIHKYIYKGYDRTMMVLESANEIKQYLDGRYIGSPEAAWHIFGHHMHEEVPTVTRLALHLPGMHRVNFNPRELLEDIIARSTIEKSTLTRFFTWYATNPNSTPHTYQEFPQFFVWNKINNVWTPRKFGFAIGRMYFASPNCGEKFYFRLLLTIVKGPKSYKDLRTVDNVVYDTFKSACVAGGLLEDDDEWVQCLEEAAIMQTGYQLRRLFCVILTQCSPLQPLELWKRFFINICDDLAHKIRTLFGILNPIEAQIEDYGLYLLNQMLEETSKSSLDFPPMPQPIENWSTVVGTTFFLNGGAGIGKTFLYNTIAHKCHSLSYIVVTVASSGIASLLLEGVLGGDFHQILPVVPKGVREEIVNASLRRSDLWDNICVLTLNLNMRLNITDPADAAFADFLMEVGTNPLEVVHLSSTIGRCQNLNELLSRVYPQLDVTNTSTPTFLTERMILSARNDDVNAINGTNSFLEDFGALEARARSLISCLKLLTLRYTYLAVDKISKDDGMDRSISNRYPNEYLNSLDPTGLPPFKLELKVGCPIILSRNIAPNDGLCNGTRMIVVSHGQLYVALSRCTSFDRIIVLLPEEETYSTTDIVYPEILL
ncbi:uncharacterized protein LOC131336209 [Rhododendron vialii]|uniref:uncharacterized protein LOC131336209 n=1 Tax=Rhododendron vialii TaxID=182163 RepID=UPI00265D6395|nr:uncharacterized protein LOC131336209 [Rhododendron vialii]